MSSLLLHGIFVLFGSVLMAVTLPGTLELLLLTVGACLPKRHRVNPSATKLFRFFVVIPAHNEELHIERCIRSISRADRSGVNLDIVVIADNCYDRTAEVAKEAGARVLERNHKDRRGKGYALDYAFQTLLAEDPDVFVVIDADSEVAPHFFLEINALFQAGAEAVQTRYLTRSENPSARTRLMRLASFAFNVVRPLGRDHWGLSVGIYGNGFALRAEVLRKVPYTAASVVEDLEYHLALIRAHQRVWFANGTTVYADIPVSDAGLQTQRSRWEGGRFRMLVTNLYPLLRQVAHGSFRSIEPLLDLLLLPLTFHVALLVLAFCIPFAPVHWAAMFGIGVLLFHLAVAFSLSDSDSRELAALVAAPFYIVWKASMLPKLLRSATANAAWVRTDRVKEQQSK